MSAEGPRDLDLLFELGSLRRVDRTWRQFGGADCANSTEHSFRVAWLAWLIAVREGADVGRVIQLALLHDTAETRTGDVNYLSRMYCRRDDAAAMRDQFADTTLSGDAAELWAEYEARETLESRIVKDADTLDCDLELQELRHEGAGLYAALRDTRDVPASKLFTRSARQLFDTIYDADPHRWHRTGRNRANEGDWKPSPTRQL